MNRYTLDGLTAAAKAGKRIIVLTVNQSEARTIIGDVNTVLDPAVEHVTRANGSESIRYLSGGRIIPRSYRQGGGRGVSADIVFIDAGVDERLTTDDWSSIYATLATRPGSEVIRA